MSDPVVPESWGDRLESLIGKRRDAWVALVLVACIVAVVLLLRIRSLSPRIAPPAPAPAGLETVAATPSPVDVFVHVAGAVGKPGLYRLPDGSRVADAIALAGGASARADVGAINLAEVLSDGIRIEVPTRAAARMSPQTVPAPVAGATATPAVVNVNSADATTLETIPGIGPVLAAAIVQHREENGPFPSVEALLDVSGIGPATLESVRPYVAV